MCIRTPRVLIQTALYMNTFNEMRPRLVCVFNLKAQKINMTGLSNDQRACLF